jgi:hypothetical protein
MYPPSPPQLSIWQSDSGECIIVTEIDGPPDENGYFVWYAPWPITPANAPDDDEVAHASLWDLMLHTMCFVMVVEASTYE